MELPHLVPGRIAWCWVVLVLFAAATLAGGEEASGLAPPGGTGFRQFNAGLDAPGRGDAMDAVTQFGAAAEAAPDSSAVAYYLGLAYYQTGERTSAEHWLAQAVQLAPASVQAWQDLAAVCQRNGDQAKLVRAVENLVRLKPRDRALQRTLRGLQGKPGAKPSNRYGQRPATEPELRAYPKDTFTCECRGKVCQETSCFITSLSPEEGSPGRLLTLLRGHWGIENRAHWVRDVTFDEDRCQVRCGSGP